MADLVLPASSAPGAIPGEGTGRLVNAQAFKDGTEVRWGAVPGLKPLASPGVGSPRGGLLVGNLLYLAREDALFTMTVANSVRRVGTLEGDRPVTMARNNRASTADSAGPDVVAVTEVGPFIITPSGIADYPGSVIGSPNDVAFLDGYFLFTYPDGTIRATGTSATPTNTTDMSDQSYTKAESNPDGLLRGTVSGDLFYAWGQKSIEVYADQGLSPFPLARQQVIAIGLFGPSCVAGFQDGWNGAQIFVAADGTVRRLDGYTPTRISTRAVERSIASVTGPNVLRASVYTYGGNAIWSLSAPGFTWEYNTTTDAWHERVSTGLSRWRGETSINAFSQWIVGDVVTGDVLAISEAYRTENGTPVVARIESAPLRQIPDRLRLGRLTLDITTGQGDPGGEVPDMTDPHCRITWSLDGGAYWAQPLIRQIGGPGQYGKRVSVGDLGRSTREGVRVAVEVSDPVQFSLRGASLPDVALREGG